MPHRSLAVVLFLLFMVSRGNSQKGMFSVNLIDEDEVANQNLFRDEIRGRIDGIMNELDKMESVLKASKDAFKEKINQLQNETISSVEVMIKAQLGRQYCDLKENNHLFRDTCYFLSTDEKDWVGAQNDCRQRKGNLAEVPSEEVFQFLRSIIKAPTWIGLRSVGDHKTFRWISNGKEQPLNTSRDWWYEKQPYDYIGFPSCVLFNEYKDFRLWAKVCGFLHKWYEKQPYDYIGYPSCVSFNEDEDFRLWAKACGFLHKYCCEIDPKYIIL